MLHTRVINEVRCPFNPHPSTDSRGYHKASCLGRAEQVTLHVCFSKSFMGPLHPPPRSARYQYPPRFSCAIFCFLGTFFSPVPLCVRVAFLCSTRYFAKIDRGEDFPEQVSLFVLSALVDLDNLSRPVANDGCFLSPVLRNGRRPCLGKK